ncbi:MAG TPA: hypothetical protein VF119_03825, partial [Candidatus Limnocylindrales bacterium]
MTPDLHQMLAPEGIGGVVDGEGPIETALLRGTANEFGARFVELNAPTTKAQVIESLVAQGAVPGWIG